MVKMKKQKKAETAYLQGLSGDFQATVTLTETLSPYPGNSRQHSENQIMELVGSITEFGFTNPILVDEDWTILAGHGRWMAAKEMGLPEVPVVIVSHLTPTQKKAYVIADNQLALNATWDMDILKEEIDALLNDDFDVDVLGFDDLEGMLAEPEAPAVKHVEFDVTDRNLLMLEFETEADLEKMFGEMKKRGVECKIMD